MGQLSDKLEKPSWEPCPPLMTRHLQQGAGSSTQKQDWGLCHLGILHCSHSVGEARTSRHCCHTHCPWKRELVTTMPSSQTSSYPASPRLLPVRRATASAAKTAVTSWRVSTTRMPSFSQATSTGEMCPPTNVKTKRTPWALSTAATFSPPCLMLVLSTWARGDEEQDSQRPAQEQVQDQVGVRSEDRGT